MRNAFACMAFIGIIGLAACSGGGSSGGGGGGMLPPPTTPPPANDATLPQQASVGGKTIWETQARPSMPAA